MTMKRNVKIEERQNSFIKWIKEHKKEVTIGLGVSVAVIIGMILGIENQDKLMEVWASLEKNIQKAPKNTSNNVLVEEQMILPVEMEQLPRSYTRPQHPVDVRMFIRNLPEGQHHSLAKEIEAEKLGITLLPSQTLVDPQSRYKAA